jgi:hypothetical protein
MPSIVAPARSDGKIVALQKAAVVSKSTLKPALMQGERLNILVLETCHNGKILLQIKDSTLLAESALPLQSGETLTVQVDQLHPILMLRMTNAADREISITNQFLKVYRSNPDALKELVVSLKALFEDGTLKHLSYLFTKREIHNLNNILKHLIISEDTLADPLFLKHYIGTLGLTSERRLMKALSDPAVLREKKGGTTLKEILLKLLAESMAVQTNTGNDEPDGCRVMQFNGFANHAITVIESLQIVNVLAQEQDGLFMLQFPVQFPDGIRMQEIFIEADRKRVNEDAEKQCRIVLFLNMDSLGEIAIDMGIMNANLCCTFKCQDQKAYDFMQPLLPALCQALSETDYAVGVIQCVLDQDIRSWMRDFLQAHSLFTQNSIDLSI